MNMLTVYILASRRNAHVVKDLWIHMSIMRRQVQAIWVEPLYVEDLATSTVVPAMPGRYVVIWCLSNQLLSALLDEPALRELLAGSIVNLPFLVSSCEWDQAPSPFVGRQPLAAEPLTSVTSSQRDDVFILAVRGIRKVVVRLIEGA